jgi:hypothetical protein
VVLGAYGIPPFGTASEFADREALWIWNTPLAQFNAPFGQPIVFSKSINVPTSTPVIIHVLVDDTATIILNGVPLATVSNGWTTTSYPQIPATLQAGPNLLQITAINLAPGGAGLLASVISVSPPNVLAHTDGTWTWTI